MHVYYADRMCCLHTFAHGISYIILYSLDSLLFTNLRFTLSLFSQLDNSQIKPNFTFDLKCDGAAVPFKLTRITM